MSAKENVRRVLLEAAAEGDSTPQGSMMAMASAMGLLDGFVGALPDDEGELNAGLAGFADWIHSLRSDNPAGDLYRVAALELRSLAGDLEDEAPGVQGFAHAAKILRGRADQLERQADAGVDPAALDVPEDQRPGVDPGDLLEPPAYAAPPAP